MAVRRMENQRVGDHGKLKRRTHLLPSPPPPPPPPSVVGGGAGGARSRTSSSATTAVVRSATRREYDVAGPDGLNPEAINTVMPSIGRRGRDGGGADAEILRASSEIGWKLRWKVPLRARSFLELPRSFDIFEKNGFIVWYKKGRSRRCVGCSTLALFYMQRGAEGRGAQRELGP